MHRGSLRWRVVPILMLSAGLIFSGSKAEAETAKNSKLTDSGSSVNWRSQAKLHHLLGAEPGDLAIEAGGVAFRTEKGHDLKWPYQEIQTFSLSAHSLSIKTYKNRHLPGVQQYRLTIDEAVPPEVAAELARRVRRPSQNRVFDSAMPSIKNVAVHHRTLTGGTNGTLRLREDGIDYVSDVTKDSRSWRWNDLQTLSKPDAFHLLVFGYRDNYTFDLKEPLPQSLFEQLSDKVVLHNTSE